MLIARPNLVLALCVAACREPEAAPAPPGMVRVPAATFMMGTDQGASHEGPAHRVSTRAFWLDRTEVTNAAFAAFVAGTHHVTVAERHGNSLVFDSKRNTWSVVDGASWRHPEGTGSSVDARLEHPVVHVAWSDAVAYCAFRGGRLPTELEWERAARGEATHRYPWGETPTLENGSAAANTWQGAFPAHDAATDGFHGTAPVGRFPATAFGLFDLGGNVWEWTADRFDASSRSIRGGSWLCGEGHCVGYRVAARGRAEPDEPTNHVGFRCAR